MARGAFGIRRVGHGGTLDPQASGLLPLLVGSATKFADRLHEAGKVYDALVRFGTETATDDREGAVTREAAVPDLSSPAVDVALATFRGAIEQVPPQYAALKVAGRTAYSRARSGETVELAARRVQVHRLDVVGRTETELRLLVVCSSGTYIRALARDLGRALGSAAHLAGLRRIAVGALEVEGAVTPQALRARSSDAIAKLRPATDDVLVLSERFVRLPAGTIVGAGESS